MPNEPETPLLRAHRASTREAEAAALLRAMNEAALLHARVAKLRALLHEVADDLDGTSEQAWIVRKIRRGLHNERLPRLPRR